MRRSTAFLNACALFGALLYGCSGGPNGTELIGGQTGGDSTSTGAETNSTGAGTGSATGGNGAAATNTSGQASSTSTGNAQDGGSCEQLTLTADRAAPDMLIVLDRSGSMTDNDSDTDRWAGSVEAVNTVVGELEDTVRFGLMTFPGAEGGDSGGGGGWDDDDDDENECAPGMLDVPIDALNADPIGSTLMSMEADGRTPTAQTLQAARQVLAETEPDPSGGGEISAGASQYVLLVTDGDPNCMDDGRGRGGDEDTAAQQATIEEVGNLTSDGVKTYVVGFQTAGSDFADVLDEMAVAGETGDTMHRSVSSGDDLLEELRSIAGSAASCSFVLSQNVDESRVEIRVDGELAEYGTGWDIREDQRTIDLLGATCDALQTGATVEAKVSCQVVNAI